jgi:uncharacterized protein DUF4142
MKKAAKGGMMEVSMGRLAEQNGKSEDVKSFGKEWSPIMARPATS